MSIEYTGLRPEVLDYTKKKMKENTTTQITAHAQRMGVLTSDFELPEFSRQLKGFVQQIGGRIYFTDNSTMTMLPH